MSWCDLARFLKCYDVTRSHQGYRLSGRTPAQALTEALNITELPRLMERQPALENAASNEAARVRPRRGVVPLSVES